MTDTISTINVNDLIDERDAAIARAEIYAKGETITMKLTDFERPLRTLRGFTVRILSYEGPDKFPIVGCVQYIGVNGVLLEEVAQWSVTGQYRAQDSRFPNKGKHALNLRKAK